MNRLRELGWLCGKAQGLVRFVRTAASGISLSATGIFLQPSRGRNALLRRHAVAKALFD
jgi:hypothetical protein